MLVLAKKGTTSPTSLTYGQALEEAICFGWIDGQVRRGDERTYLQRFTPRRARSRWSKRNTTLAERLIAGAGCGLRESPRSSAQRPTDVGRLPTLVPRRPACPTTW